MSARRIAVLATVALLAVACAPVAPAPAPAPATRQSQVGAATTQVVSNGHFTGKSFDKCAAPTTSNMTSWLASPYRGVGIYLGGRNAACPPSSVPHLGPAWVQTVTSQGWRLLPLWVGRQAPCSTAGYPATKLISTNTFAAALQGIEEANDAATVASEFGISSASPYTFGSPIYFDLEAYPREGICSAAVRTFVSYWTTRLHELGYRAGFYSSGASGIADEVDVAFGGLPYNTPDELWFAHWNLVDSAYSSPYVPDYLWHCHRHHQYQGGHNELYGGVQLNIDSSASDGGVAQRVVGSSGRTQAWPPFAQKCRI